MSLKGGTGLEVRTVRTELLTREAFAPFGDGNEPATPDEFGLRSCF